MSASLLKLGRAVFAYAPFVLYVGGLFAMGSGQPGGAPPMNDKLLHFLGFIPLEVLGFRAVNFWRNGATPGCPGATRTNLAALALASAVGAALEVWQYFLPHRSFEVLDWVFDTAGASLAALGIALFWRGRDTGPGLIGGAQSSSTRTPDCGRSGSENRSTK